MPLLSRMGGLRARLSASRDRKLVTLGMRFQELLLPLASVLLAAVVATLLFIIPSLVQIEERWNIVVVSQGLTLARTVFIVAAVHALVLGLPLFYLLRSMRRIGVASSALGGILIGAVPFGVLTMISMFGPYSASSGGRPTVINGVPTLAGWIDYAYAVGSIGMFGLAGGLTFWAAMRLSGQIAGKPNKPEAQSSKLRGGALSTVCVAVLLTCTLLILPSVVRDNSCHNLFRDGRTSVGPQISADLKLPAEDWPKLRKIFVDFGAAHSLSFRSDERIRGANIVWRDLNLCNEAGLNIDAVDQPWLTQINSSLADRGMNFSVYTLQPTSEWKPLARDLLNSIEMTWPQKTTFRGPNGKVTSVEEALKGRR